MDQDFNPDVLPEYIAPTVEAVLRPRVAQLIEEAATPAPSSSSK
jgi:hypothetical protein